MISLCHSTAVSLVFRLMLYTKVLKEEFLASLTRSQLRRRFGHHQVPFEQQQPECSLRLSSDLDRAVGGIVGYLKQNVRVASLPEWAPAG